MKLLASDFYTLYQPSFCGLRVYLQQTGQEEAPAGPYAEMLRRLGERHERNYLETLPALCNLAAYPTDERITRTLAAIRERLPVLYHPLFQATVDIQGHTCEIRGEPDLLLAEPGGYVIRDIKLSRRISETEHPEIIRQLQLYGRLFELATGQPPLRLEVFSGQRTVLPIAYNQGRAALEALQEVLEFKTKPAEPYSPVGWSKCAGCGFRGYCWPRAERQGDVALVAGLDQGLALALRERNVHTVNDLVQQFDHERLAQLARPCGGRLQRVGKAADAIWLNARALASGREIFLQKPELPEARQYVMFDLEGLPPQLDDLQKIYLWGLRVYGGQPGPYQPAVAGFGPEGDFQGWQDFLGQARDIFTRCGDLPFIHWHNYEKTHVRMYLERYGDAPDGSGARVLRNLVDLLPITKKSLALPLPSYSLKVVEKYIGFKRGMEEYGGEWSMAKYIEAVETENEQDRRALMEKILQYNREDLDATWAVLRWLKGKS